MGAALGNFELIIQGTSRVALIALARTYVVNLRILPYKYRTLPKIRLLSALR